MSAQNQHPLNGNNGPIPRDPKDEDSRWAAVDEYTLSHLHPSTKPNHALLEATLENSRAKGLPSIQTSSVQSKFLALQCRLGKVKHVLEIGTLGGYTPIFIATENPGIKITTIEVSPEHALVARENIANAGVSDQIEVLIGPAIDILPILLADLETGKRERFGLTYIDADKLNNWNYFDFGVRMSVPGGCVIVDNMVTRGDLVDEGKRGGLHVVGAREVIEKAGKDERVDAVVMQVVASKSYDGFLMAVLK